MRPLALVMEGFGPYATRQELDFRTLGARALLLIHGPTGAGKTTILDAMTYALYGQSSGDERGADDVRSDFVGVETPTQVSFDFALGERTYRVQREPEYQRKAKRGERTVRNAPSATLWRTDAGDEVLATGLEKVTETVGELMGLSAQQFRQVIVLPQGRFRELLTAEVDEREDILCRLFPTDVYRRVQDDLAARLAETQAQMGEAAVRQRTILETQGVADAVQLEARIAELMLELDQQVRERTQHEEAMRELDALFAKARDEKKALDLVRELEARKRALAEKAGEQARRVAELERARAAAAVAAHEEPAELAARAVRSAEEELAREGERLKTARAQRDEALELREEHERRAPERDRAVARLADLERHREAAAALEKARLEAARLAPLKAAAAAALAKAEREAQAAREKAALAEQEVQKAATLKAQLDGLASAAELARGRLEARRKLAGAAAEAERARAAQSKSAKVAQDAAAELVAAERAYDATQRAWIEGQAGRLAQQLVAGEACPVCGGTEHPSPAHAVEGAPSNEDLDRAAKLRTERRAAADAARDRAAKDEAVAAERGAAYARLEVELGEVAAQVVDALAQEAAAAQARFEDVQATVTREPALVKARDDARASCEALARAVTEWRDKDRDAYASHQAAAAVEEQARGALPAELQKPGAIQREVDSARASVAAYDERKGALARRVEATEAAAQERERELARRGEAVRTAREKSEEARAAYERERVAAGFADERAFRDALRAPAAMAALADAATRHETEVRVVGDQLAAASEAARHLTEPDLAAIEGRRALALARYNELSAACGTKEEVIRGQRDALASYRSAVAESEEILARTATVRRIAQLVCASGDTAVRLTLQRYVLGAYLDRVLERATYRLQRMTHGRFVIRRRSEPGDKRRADGLNLEILDEHTGRPRPAHTLSGGESFLAALSLALGLSDEVQARAGGYRLDTIFVDEGFGSLDEEALDEAIKTLTDLQKGGRLVGIISHVPQLRERIDTRLEVRSSPRGSEARLHVG